MANKPQYIAFADMQIQGDWRVEFVNESNGEIYITIFSGADCERRAVEYAAFKNGLIPLPKAKVETPQSLPPAPPPKDQVTLVTKDGEELIVRINEMSWQFNEHLGRIIGVKKPAIERVVGAVRKGKKQC